jgi:hypothetical protein
LKNSENTKNGKQENAMQQQVRDLEAELLRLKRAVEEHFAQLDRDRKSPPKPE